MSLKTTPGLGKSGMSRMRLRSAESPGSSLAVMPSLYHIRPAHGRSPGGPGGEVEEGVAGDVVPPDLEVEVRSRGPSAAPDGGDHLALAHEGARPDPVLPVVRVDGRVAPLVLED